MKLGSLFDGSGGFPLAGSFFSIEPVWASEIEPYPIAVTRSRFPNMKHLGNVCEINGTEIEPVDIITFGSPCQDLSIAGRRAGLEDGKRSNLFYEAIRIIKEMRNATNGEYPKYIVWENVPGAFSSNKGEDFRTVIEKICSVCSDTVSIPKPPKGKWLTAGEVMGDNFSVAWRTMDAQYWGVPQRRRRIYLVADFTGGCAGKILFESEGEGWDSAKSGASWKGFARGIEGGVESIKGYDAYKHHGWRKNNRLNTLTVRQNNGVREDTPLICDINTLYVDTTQPTVFAGESITSKYNASNPQPGDPCHTLDTDSRNYLVQSAICLQGNGIDRADTTGCNGKGWTEDVSYTLNTIDRHAVSTFSIQRSDEYMQDDVAATQAARQYKSATDLVAAIDCRNACEQPINGTLQAKPNGGFSYNCNNVTRVGYTVRRLTPLECNRLQGFPDDWGNIDEYNGDVAFWESVRKTFAEANGNQYRPVKNIKSWYDKLQSDSSEYKMWGNGIALPNAMYVLFGIAQNHIYG